MQSWRRKCRAGVISVREGKENGVLEWRKKRWRRRKRKRRRRRRGRRSRSSWEIKVNAEIEEFGTLQKVCRKNRLSRIEKRPGGVWVCRIFLFFSSSFLKIHSWLEVQNHLYSCCGDNNLDCTAACAIERTKHRNPILTVPGLVIEMKRPTCIVNQVCRFLNLGRHHITFGCLDVGL